MKKHLRMLIGLASAMIVAGIIAFSLLRHQPVPSVEEDASLRALAEAVIDAARPLTYRRTLLDHRVRFDAAVEEVAVARDFDAEELRATLKAWAKAVAGEPDADPFDRALAEFFVIESPIVALEARYVGENCEGTKVEKLHAFILQGDLCLMEGSADMHGAYESRKDAADAYRQAAGTTIRDVSPRSWAKANLIEASLRLDGGSYSDTAESTLREVIDVYETHDPESAELAMAKGLLGSALMNRAGYGRVPYSETMEKARPHLERAVALGIERWGKDDLRTVQFMDQLGYLLGQGPNLEAAVGILGHVVRRDFAAFGRDHELVVDDLLTFKDTVDRGMRAFSKMKRGDSERIRRFYVETLDAIGMTTAEVKKLEAENEGP